MQQKHRLAYEMLLQGKGELDRYTGPVFFNLFFEAEPFAANF